MADQSDSDDDVQQQANQSAGSAVGSVMRHLLALRDAALAANEAAAPIINAISRALSLTSAGVVTAVLAKVGLDNAEAVQAAVAGLTDERAAQVSRVVSAATDARLAGADVEQIAAGIVSAVAALDGHGGSDHAAIGPLAVADHRGAGAEGPSEASVGPSSAPTAPAPPTIGHLKLAGGDTTPENATGSIGTVVDPNHVATSWTVSDPRFSIDARGQLSLTSPVDFEAEPGGIDVTVTASHAGAKPVSTVLHLTIEDVNEAPVVASIDNAGPHAENTGFDVTVTATDPEQGTITKVVHVGPADFEAMGPGHTLHIEGDIVDSGGLTAHYSTDIAIADANEAPNTPEVSATFDGAVLRVDVTATDPDAGDTVAPLHFEWTAAQLAAGVDPFSVSLRDAGGLASPSITLDPPKLAAAAEADHPTAPTILSVSAPDVAENSSGTVTVTAWDAIDGMITRTIAIGPQDYEALGSGKTVLSGIDVTNSSGLTAHAGAVTHILDVNEAAVLQSVETVDRHITLAFPNDIWTPYSVTGRRRVTHGHVPRLRPNQQRHARNHHRDNQDRRPRLCAGRHGRDDRNRKYRQPHGLCRPHRRAPRRCPPGRR